MSFHVVGSKELVLRLKQLESVILQVEDNPTYYIYKMITNNGIKTIKSDLPKEEFLKQLNLVKK